MNQSVKFVVLNLLLLLSFPVGLLLFTPVSTHATKHGAAQRAPGSPLTGIAGNRAADRAERRPARTIPDHTALTGFTGTEPGSGVRVA